MKCIAICLFLITTVKAQTAVEMVPTRHAVDIGFTLISTSLQRGGGGFGLNYYCTMSDEFRVGLKGHYGFYGYEKIPGQNAQANSISLMPSIRLFLLEDVYADIDAGLYREESDIIRSKSGTLNNHFAYAFGFGYAIHYSPKISALIGVRSYSVRGKGYDPYVEHQFMVSVGVTIRIMQKG
jgi:hypothetical protein